jgi:cytochrome P450
MLPTASWRDTLGVFAGVVAPNVAKGPIIRRPRVVGLAERMNLDQRAVRRMQRLQDRYGPGPLMLRVPGQPRAVILAPEHVHRVLHQSPDPFATDSSEKRAALAHFQPQGVLISRGAERTVRRRYNEAVLEAHRPIHELASRFISVVEEEVGGLLKETRVGGGGRFSWDEFAVAWFRVVRRVVLGDAARNDQELTDEIARLRAHANWAMFHPIDSRLQHRFFHRLQGHLTRAEPGSLAAVMAATPADPTTAPAQQVPQWLFAFDSAGIATSRALALLATHASYAEQARAEAGECGARRHPLPLLRATLLEAVRLWPTTPMILRETTQETTWQDGVMPAGIGILIYAPFFHRDERSLPFANRFFPEAWSQDHPVEPWSLVPFSDGPAACPGRNLVLLLASATLAVFLRHGPLRLAHPARLGPHRELPATLNNYALRFELGS